MSINDLNNMAFYIRSGELFPFAVQRIANENTKRAIKMLTRGEDIHEEVHEARRQFKMIRAAFRLIRDDLGEEQFKQKNRFFRNTGRELSSFRDSSALIETVILLKKAFGTEVQEEVFDEVIQSLERERSVFSEAVATETGAIQKVSDALARRREEINLIRLEKASLSNVVQSLKRVYYRGYMNFIYSLSEVRDDRIHEWRKRAKYLRYQMNVLKYAWLPHFSFLAKELHQLTDYLGDYQNITVLKEKLNTDTLDIREAYKLKMLELSGRYQQTLLERAFPLARKIYCEKPKAFAKRIECYLNDFIHT